MNYYSKKILLLLLMMASALSMSAVTASDINAIKAGNILHCFDWTYAQIQAELDNIKAAGFTSIQTSPAQANYEGSTSWSTLYRPRDTEVGPNTLGTKAQLTALCTAAHQKGLYIIVDVVANHTDGSLAWVADYWKNTDLYHDMTCDYSANDGSRYAVTHGDIGMCDLKTYDSRVYNKFKTYIQALKACGVDGIRWDAAKHIGLPSEGDEFWNNALDKSMYNYGEVLHTMGGGSDGTTIPQLQGYMSVTDANYGTNNVLSSFKSGRAPSVAGCWAMEFNNDKWVYWGESHDTFCNGDGASKGVGQNVVDRAYAVAAAHNNIPALYFSRPNGGDNAGPGCQAGQKGSTHFTSKEVAEINKLKLLCAGEPDYYSESNGNCSVTRKSGAVIVKGNGSGNVSVPNGGAYLAPGEYTDHVSGGKFTVTATTISGSVGSSGIAVLYGNATPRPTVSVSVYFNNTQGWEKVYVYNWKKGTETNVAPWPGTQLTEKTAEGYYKYEIDDDSYDMIIFNDGNGTQTDDLGVVANHLYTPNGDSGEYVSGGDDDGKGRYTITYDNPEGWSSVNCYVWDAGDGNKEYFGSWPGAAMTKVGNVWTITLEVDKKLINGGIVFNTNGSPQTKDLALSQYSVFTLDKTPTSQPAVHAAHAVPTVLYTLQGIRVDRPVKGGIYISNGRKVIVK